MMREGAGLVVSPVGTEVRAVQVVGAVGLARARHVVSGVRPRGLLERKRTVRGAQLPMHRVQ